MNVRRPLAVMAMAALALTACGDDPNDVAPATEPTADGTDATIEGTAAPDTTDVAGTTAPETTEAAPVTTLDLAAGLGDRTFRATAIEGYELVDGSEIVLTFEGENLGAAGGCNQIGSTWSLEGDVLVVPEPRMTMMACEPASLMDQDTWLAAVLTSRPTVAVDGDTMTLTAEGTVITFESPAVDPVPLEGTTWLLESIVDGDAVSSIPAGVRKPTLEFDGGTVAVFAGCNTGSGSYTVEGAEITFGPIATTRIACEGDSQVVEQAVLTVLTGTASYEIDGDSLWLTTGPEGLILRAAPEGGTPPEGLEGVPWLLDSIVDANTTTAIAAGVRKPTLEFDGTDVAVFAGCNTGSGSYTVEGDQITFGPIATTRIACEGDSQVVEQAVLTVLTGTATATIADGVLTLMNGDQGLHYTSG